MPSYTERGDMTRERTAPGPRLTERHKARFRLPLFFLLAVFVPVLVGVGSILAWGFYVLFVVLYSLWALRLTSTFARDRRLGYLLCLTDVAVLLPLLLWDPGRAVRSVVIVTYAAGLVLTFAIARARVRAGVSSPISFAAHRETGMRNAPTPEMVLEQAVRTRLMLYATTGARFGLVILRVLRFDEAATVYGADGAARMVSAIGRRGLRHLGPDAQRFPLSRGRVAFLFEIEPSAAGRHAAGGEWSEPYDVEGMAMRLGRKTCEHLIEGHRVECVVGWASAPADGLTADDLLFTAENGTRSTEAFRRVNGAQVAARVVPTSGVSRRISAAAPEQARTAVG